ncbi:MAG: DUF2254 domain-containing protein [Devosia sp.]|nr:DUF2254 domain-containing protein [Alphaproteobacteria bacterium]MBU1563352.1 DUF2254 domain-containing protein [Alphaproteobacteria bacterium]MBU2301159.1 DUF2254 domain-containing protein [Alphaproteobacteria bacterium]MBU2366820.1 DUF2254 domain-containing protein [Alphaproteobacteria bacterium]
MSQIAFQFRQLVQRMWFLPAAFSLVAVLTIFIAYGLARFAPEKLPFTMPSDGVVSILSILASSLLTVAVFALSTMVSALSTASASTTPRAVPLIVGDRSAQTSISVFIGAFLFAIVGIIGLNAGFYSEAGRLFLFLVTLGVVLLVVAALIRWIGQISAIGRVQETIDRVEYATTSAFEALSAEACFDCTPQRVEPKGATVMAETIGYVQHFDASQLQQLAEEHDLTVAVTARPGAYAGPDRPLLRVEGKLDDELRRKLAECFTVGDTRTFDSDPRFGLVVMGEIASKALSPGINDPGTAIDVIGTLVRVLHERDGAAADEAPKYDRISVPPLRPHDLVEDGFRPIARDGAAVIEVVQRLLAGLETIAATCPDLAEAALEMARDATERARTGLTASSDLRALEAAAAFVDAPGRA